MRASEAKRIADEQRRVFDLKQGMEYLAETVAKFATAGMYSFYASLSTEDRKSMEDLGYVMEKYKGGVYKITWGNYENKD